MKPQFGFRELAHTADWELQVWAPDLATLLEQAARGMYAITGMQLNASSPEQRSLAIHASDAEGLLVRFLGELLWLEQAEGLAFDRISIKVNEANDLWAELQGGPVSNLDKEIKAVTYHNMKVETTAQGLQVNITFDV